MNDRPELAKLAAELLADDRVDVLPPSAEDEARAIELVAGAIEAGRRRRQRRTAIAAGVGALALAAGLAGLRLVGHSQQRSQLGAWSGSDKTQAVRAPGGSVVGHVIAGDVRVLRDGHDVALGEGTALAVADRIVASGGRASLAFSTGTHVVVERGSDVTLAEGGLVQRFDLVSGSVRADVAKLRPGERFVVRTADTEVEVRGTSFLVAVVPKHACGVPSATEVSVSEGKVWVRFGTDETVLSAGESWPPPCTTLPAREEHAAAVHALGSQQQGFGLRAPAGHVGAAPAAAAGNARPITTTSGLAPTPGAVAVADAVPGSDLAGQNRAFEDALSAKRRGDSAGALSRFDRFLARYPQSPLVESAMAERMRLLAGTDPSRAQEAATQYLAGYPSGFAAAEARSLVARAR